MLFGDDAEQRREGCQQHVRGQSGITGRPLSCRQARWWPGAAVPAPPQYGIEHVLALPEDVIPCLGRCAQSGPEQGPHCLAGELDAEGPQDGVGQPYALEHPADRPVRIDVTDLLPGGDDLLEQHLDVGSVASCGIVVPRAGGGCGRPLPGQCIAQVRRKPRRGRGNSAGQGEDVQPGSNVRVIWQLADSLMQDVHRLAVTALGGCLGQDGQLGCEPEGVDRREPATRFLRRRPDAQHATATMCRIRSQGQDRRAAEYLQGRAELDLHASTRI